MVQKNYLENSVFISGLWYYQVRALPIKPLIKEYGKRDALLLKMFEMLARLKWKNPMQVLWDVDDFRVMMRKYGLAHIANVYRGNFGLPVIIPRTRFFYDAFSTYPNLNAVYGDRGAGKTIFAWITANEVYLRNKDRYDEFKIIVYGDIDGLAKEIQKYHPDPQFRKSIVMMDDYDAQEAEKGVGKFIIYNELDESLMSQATLTREGKALQLMIFRSRHYQYWMFYNIIRMMNVQKTIRITSSFQSYKPMSINLLGEILDKGMRKEFRSVLLQALSRLKFNEALVSIPLYRADKMGLKNIGSRQMFSITPVDAPEWLLKATQTAEKNFDVGSIAQHKKEKKMIEIGAEWYLEQMSVSNISMKMESMYGFGRSREWWRNKLMDFFGEMGYSNLNEVKKDVILGRISPEVIRRRREAGLQS